MKTHPLNVSYLVIGLVYLGIAGVWGLHAADVVDSTQTRWLLPLTLVVAGVTGLAAFAAKSLRHGDDPTYDDDSTTIREGDDR